MPAYNARRLGVMYVIFDGRIWSSYRAGDGWRAYTGGESHADHIHISMSWAGAAKRTSWWTGKAVGPDYGPCVQIQGNAAPPWSGPRDTPCPTPIDPMTLTGTPLLAREATGAYVVQLQLRLSVTPVTGFFGPITEAALTAFQKAHGLPVTATTTPATWSALRGGSTVSPPPAPTTQTVTAGRALPATMRYSVRKGDSLSRIAATWGSSVGGIKSASRLTSDTIRVGQIVIVPVRSGITKFTWTWLDKGDQGVAVKALQTALRMKPKYRTGLFGDITKAEVNKLKAAHGWPVDGVAGPGVWRALGA
jgi:peptidoglycan hydrolase-like protein with peptidoglycan-binding domain